MSHLKLPIKEQDDMNSVLFVTVTLSVTGYLEFPVETLKVLAYQSKVIFVFTVSRNQIAHTEGIIFCVYLSQMQQ